MEHELFMVNTEGNEFRVTVVCRNSKEAEQLVKLVYEVSISRESGREMTVEQMFDEAQQVIRRAHTEL